MNNSPTIKKEERQVMKDHSVNCHMYYCKNRTKDHIYMDFHTCNCQPSKEKFLEEVHEKIKNMKDQYGHKVYPEMSEEKEKTGYSELDNIQRKPFDRKKFEKLAKEIKMSEEKHIVDIRKKTDSEEKKCKCHCHMKIDNDGWIRGVATGPFCEHCNPDGEVDDWPSDREE